MTTENLYQQAGNWRGGPAARANPDPCPKCGGNQYFANIQVSKRGPQPAGHCYNCFAGWEMYLTEDGLQSFGDTVGTMQKVLNHEGKWVEAEIREFGMQPLQTVIFRPGLRRSNLRHRVAVTPDHRWLTLNRGEVTDLRLGDDVPFIGGGAHYNEEGWIAGFGFGDGTIDAQGRARVQLCGDKKLQLGRFERFGHSSRFDYRGDPIIIFHKGWFLDWKQLPHGRSVDWLVSWLDGYLAADGDSRGISSQDGEAIEFVKQVAPFAGYMVTGHHIESSTETNYGPRSSALHRLTIHHHQDLEHGLFRVVAIEMYDPTLPADEQVVEPQPVFCAVVEDGHSFVLANGILTGNCGFNDGMFDQGLASSWGAG